MTKLRHPPPIVRLPRGTLYINIQAYAEASIDDTVPEMVALAQRCLIDVWTRFNGVEIIATPDSDPGRLLAVYYKSVGGRSFAPEGGSM